MNFMEQKGARVYEAGDVIFKEGSEGSSMFIIHSGEVEVSSIKNKQKVVYAILSQGAIFGEMALIDGAPRSATVTALKHTTCVEMSRMLFQKNLDGLPQWMTSFFQILAERLREANKKADTMTTKDNSRQVVLMVSNMLSALEPNTLDEIVTPWKPLVQDISLVLNLPNELVDKVLNKITLTPMARSEMSFEHGRVFIMKEYKQFRHFADYCKSRFLEKQGKEIPPHFQKISEKEQSLSNFLYKIMREQRWEPEIEQHLFEDRFAEECDLPLAEYTRELRKFRNMGIISSRLDADDVKMYSVHKEQLQNMVSISETIQEFEGMDGKL